MVCSQASLTVLWSYTWLPEPHFPARVPVTRLVLRMLLDALGRQSSVDVPLLAECT